MPARHWDRIPGFLLKPRKPCRHKAHDDLSGSLAAASLRWTASAWRLVVNAPSIRMARQESRQLADRLESLSLPRPTTGGYLMVNSTSSVTAQGKPRIATEVVITWNRGLTVYQVTTYSDVRQRMATALAIAHSMHLYESARS